ncbi:hypothetical protein M378DRAFT_761324 [Amanita muscaria Koide BX008]|uniref:Uncharacterized protein n=1 Tax=Amanita muscaria (strain Koide BX008) TaxID=946122 RepID=A0A0C2T7F4_AMAMK|nr:hypothetical protein M378DRAFT_761324 [Amanita muscaria Koide BX008]
MHDVLAGMYGTFMDSVGDLVVTKNIHVSICISPCYARQSMFQRTRAKLRHWCGEF